jgi:hypothetical protein
VATLVDQVQVDLAQGRREAVRVVLDVFDAVGPGHREAVVHGALRISPHRRPHALGLVGEVEGHAVLEAHLHRLGQGFEDPDPQAAGLEVLPQQVVRLLVAALDERGDGAADLGTGCGVHVGSP